MTVSWCVSRDWTGAEKKWKMAESGRFTRVRLLASVAFLWAVFATGSATAQVPLLMWSNDGLPQFPSPSVGHITSLQQLKEYLSSAFGAETHTVLLFLQDKLSREDFTVFGGVFGNKEESAFPNLEAALQSSPVSLELPALEWGGSSAVPALLQEQLAVAPVLTDADTLTHLSLNSSANNLLLFNLPYCTGLHKSCKEVLTNNDRIIGEVLKVMAAKNVPYTAFYTGLEPSRVISDAFISSHSAGRTLLQTVESDVREPIMFNESGSPCIMLWAQNLTVSFDGSTWTDLGAETPSLSGSLCNGTSSLLVLNYPSGATLSFAMSERLYPVSARDWFTLDLVQLQFNGSTASYVGSHAIYAPAEYSYHCQAVTSYQDALLIPSNTTVPWRLNFIDFQIQGFRLTNGTNFSYASDCAGFFTPGIWMGLLTGLLMLLILVYGLHMIMQLNTMDRFDDPKGPSISVPQTE